MTPPVADFGGRRVLFVMATDHEYGPALRARIEPVITGVGPIEAAAGTAVALAAGDRLPDLIVSLGSAGSRRCELGRVYQVSEVAWRDVDASPLGIPAGITPFADFPAVLPLATPLGGWPSASLSTGADVVSGAAYAGIAADMVDMETYAVVRAAARFGVRVMGLRGVSDGPGELGGLLDWTGLLGVLDERLAAAVDALETALGQDEISGSRGS